MSLLTDLFSYVINEENPNLNLNLVKVKFSRQISSGLGWIPANMSFECKKERLGDIPVISFSLISFVMDCDKRYLAMYQESN